MALRCGDGFAHYSAAQMIRKWDVVNSGVLLGTSYGRGGGYGAYLEGGFTILSQGAIAKNLPVGPITGWGYFGQAVRIPEMGTEGWYLVNGVYDPAAGGAMHIGVWVGVDGSIGIGTVQSNNFSTIMDIREISNPGIISANAFRYIETGFKINNVSGGVVARVDGVEVVSYTGDTRIGASNHYGVSTNNYFTRVVCGGGYAAGGPGNGFHLCDFYHTDDIVTADDPYNIGFLGDVSIIRSDPMGVGVSTQFTAVGASNWENVDDVNPDDVSTYNKDNVVGHEDLFEMTDLPSNIVSIQGLLINSCVQKEDVTTRQYAQLTRSGGITDEVALRSAPSAWLNQQDPKAINPRTGNLWTIPEYNAIQAGYRIKL